MTKTVEQLEARATNVLIGGTLAVVLSMGVTMELLGLAPAMTMSLVGLATVGFVFWTRRRP
jgi:Kef-type K+ transport system membrane component KefB